MSKPTVNEMGSTSQGTEEPLISSKPEVQPKVGIRIDDESISVKDLTDSYNEMTALLTNHGDTFYGRKRQFKKAKALLEEFLKTEASKTATYSDVTRMLRENGINFHSFCAID